MKEQSVLTNSKQTPRESCMESTTATIDWEGELAGLLGELSSVQGDLLAVLGEKRQRMAEHNLAGMQALQPREAELGDRLEACHQRRSQLLELAAQRGMPGDSIGKLAASLPGKPAQLGKQVKETSQRMRLLQHQSLTNWVLAQRSLLHLSQLLEIVATGGRLQPTYGKGASAHARGALVDQEA
jgi:flagellar biosynthesis/type III secretory pathway chaperone